VRGRRQLFAVTHIHARTRAFSHARTSALTFTSPPLTVPAQPGDTDSAEYKELVQQAKAAKKIPKRGYENRGSWMDRDAYEWTYCSHTGKEKPPRAHYDHITEKLVLNMDHYW
jgi:hypothetical protein